MKISEKWLRRWVDPDVPTEALVERLTLAGLEVDSAEPVGAALDGVIVGEVLEVSRHPDADRLTVCRVAAGGEERQVVCGAPNVRSGMRSALAVPGTVLPNGVKLRKAKLRGVASEGMLCSVAELGLGEEADGIMELPGDATPGTSLAELLDLPDTVIDIDLTPNRGDCFSVLGVAREVATFTGAPLADSSREPVADATDDVYPIEVSAPDRCPRFIGRVVKGIDAHARTPLWMQERLRRCGLRSIHPVVDVTNYVLLEYGQPLHGYDLSLLSGALQVRNGRSGESFELLDGRIAQVDDEVLVIADDSGPIGLAGIMGGASTAVTDNTADVLLEGAFFTPAAIAGRARRFGLHTDASMRFERGVDPEGQRRAIEYATRLLTTIAGGSPGPLTERVEESDLPQRTPVNLRRSRLARVLGVSVPDEDVKGILERLGMTVAVADDGWRVTPPSFRFDLAIEEDLIEEIARVYGYDEIPEIRARGAVALPAVTETRVDRERVRSLMVDRGYHEAITYSFVDPGRQRDVLGQEGEIALSNPISHELSVMRASLLPGLLEALARNLSRQRERVRLFEIGVCFAGPESRVEEILRLSAVAAGPVLPEQWAEAVRSADFFDIKSDLQAALALGGNAGDIHVQPGSHPAMHPGQCGQVMRGDKTLGHLGRVHPVLAGKLDVPDTVVLFEVDFEGAFAGKVPASSPISRFPSVRRDIAVLVAQEVPVGTMTQALASLPGEMVKAVRVFDVYRGKGIEAGLKSVALGLILQESSRTLTDDETDAVVRSAVQILKSRFGARLRD
ncbi:MAG: phenylalanine--tRNA ligase subunit beta [Gammaproteobacteria bacterium]